MHTRLNYVSDTCLLRVIFDVDTVQRKPISLSGKVNILTGWLEEKRESSIISACQKKMPSRLLIFQASLNQV